MSEGATLRLYSRSVQGEVTLVRQEPYTGQSVANDMLDDMEERGQAEPGVEFALTFSDWEEGA